MRSVEVLKGSSDEFKQYNFDFGSFFFFEDFIISEMNENAVLTFQKCKELYNLIKEKYKNKNFGYISNRINSYTINPLDYTIVNEYLENLIVMTVVCYDNRCQESLSLEKKVLNTTLKDFNNLKEAIDWTDFIVKKERLFGRS